MFKFIFFVLVLSVFAIYFSDVILDSTTILTVATSSMVGALHLIFQVLAVSFTSMLSFYYLKLALYIGVLFFVVSYILKWLTGHHLMTEEDIEDEEQIIQQDFLNEKEYKTVPTFIRQKDIYSKQQTYDLWHNLKTKHAKNENIAYESNLKNNKVVKNYEKIIEDNYLKELEEFRKNIRERKRKK